jgi:hypothetical protein
MAQIRNLSHAQRMLDHQHTLGSSNKLGPSDPREQPVDTFRMADIFDATLRFRKRLKASEQVKTLAVILANAHYLYEGWQTPPSHVSLRHTTEAERAIRACSEPCRSAATTAMEHYVVTEMERLTENIQRKACDWPQDRIEAEWKRIARQGRETFDWHLLNEVGRSAEEMRQLDETPLED